MRLLPLCIAVVIAGSITSCGFKANEDVPAAQNPTTIPAQTAGVNDSSSLATALSGNKIPAAAATPTTATTPATTSSSAALNPEHGKPGHRCDIAVGAPLNSAPTVITAPATNNASPTTTTTTTTTPNPIPVSTNPTPTQPAKTGAGLNPAHGQPGHRCDIAVGAPLDSKPTAATTTNAPAAAPTIIQGGSPVNANTQKSTVSPIPVTPVATAPQTTTTTAPGMNPAHGQPGHRCDIAVGAPLNSKPTTTKQ